MWGVFFYFFFTYAVLAVVILRIARNNTSDRFPQRSILRITYKIITSIVVMILLSFLSVFIPALQRSVIIIPGVLVLVTFVLVNAYASPLYVAGISICLIVASTYLFYLGKSEKNASKYKLPVYAAFLLLLLPLIPYAVVEAQTVTFDPVIAESAGDRNYKIINISNTSVTIAYDKPDMKLIHLEKVRGGWQQTSSCSFKDMETPVSVFPPYCCFDQHD